MATNLLTDNPLDLSTKKDRAARRQLEAKILKFMREMLSDFIDDCGELNHTALGESTAHALCLWVDGDDIPEIVWDLAIKAGDLGPL